MSIEALPEDKALPPFPSFARVSVLLLLLVIVPSVQLARAVIDMAVAAPLLEGSGGCLSAIFHVTVGFLGAVSEGVIVVDAVDIVDLRRTSFANVCSMNLATA